MMFKSRWSKVEMGGTNGDLARGVRFQRCEPRNLSGMVTKPTRYFSTEGCRVTVWA
jgi:hypothetical protein